jgi:hypothetical protein
LEDLAKAESGNVDMKSNVMAGKWGFAEGNTMDVSPY